MVFNMGLGWKIVVCSSVNHDSALVDVSALPLQYTNVFFQFTSFLHGAFWIKMSKSCLELGFR